MAFSESLYLCATVMKSQRLLIVTSLLISDDCLLLCVHKVDIENESDIILWSISPSLESLKYGSKPFEASCNTLFSSSSSTLFSVFPVLYSQRMDELFRSLSLVEIT